jgi:cyclopropane-fatty-acyl-phospholipid synthase
MTAPIPSTDRRLAAARRLIAHLAERSPMPLDIRLWNGEVVPLGPGSSGDVRLAIHGPDAITRLLRRPRLSTLIEQIALGRIAIEGGTLLDLAARRGEGGTRGLWRKLDKRLLATALLPFLFARSAPAGAAHAYRGAQVARDSDGRDNKALVQFHYDLSNSFYGLFLDPEMQYSCGYFPEAGTDLAGAQQAKMEMICRKLRLRPGERFLDIGCGWGGLVCHAARHHGVLAHGVTLSQAQFDFARDKIARLGLRDRVTIELKDYRELSGSYDKIASIGMFEHVGLANAPTYFAQMRALLRPRGLMLHHAITRPAKRTDRAFRRGNPEYRAIVDYIFPGGELDHIGRTVTSIERAGFEVHDVEGWREHYARTTRAWCERLYAAREAAIAEVGEAKTQIWLLYLAGVSLAFERGTVGIFQTLASRRARGLSGLPPTRADLYR